MFGDDTMAEQAVSYVSGNSLKNARASETGSPLDRAGLFLKRPAFAGAFSLAALAVCASLTIKAAENGSGVEGRIIDGMVLAQTSRFDRFEAYTRTQHYAVTAERFNLKADLVARIHRDRLKGKTYEIISRSGSTVIQTHVFEPLLEAEIATSKQSGELLTPENYSFRLTGQEDFAGKHCYVLTTEPKHKDKRLLKGRIWVDTGDFGIVHVEGRPSESLSFWVGRPMIVQDFTKISGYWWATQRHSHIDNMFLGKSDLLIDYSDYQFELRQPHSTTSSRPR
jgi:hypothetical protein